VGIPNRSSIYFSSNKSGGFTCPLSKYLTEEPIFFIKIDTKLWITCQKYETNSQIVDKKSRKVDGKALKTFVLLIYQRLIVSNEKNYRERRRNKMKKHGIFMKIILMLMIVSMLSACAPTVAKTETPATAPAETTAPASSTEDYPVIRMAYTRMFATGSEAKIEDALNVIMRKEAHAVIDLVPVDFASMNTQFNLLLTGSSDSIDIFSSFWYMPLGTLYANGQVAPLDDLLASDGQGILDLFKDTPKVLDSSKINGKLYGIPSYGPYSSPMIYVVKKTDSDNAGIDWTTVKSLDDVTAAILKMKEANPDHYYVPGATQTYWIPKDIDYFGDTNFLGVLTDPLNSTTVENYYTSDYFMNFLKNVKIWQENQVINPDSMSNTNPTLMSIQYGITSGTPGYGWNLEEWEYESNLQQTYGDDMTGAQIGDRIITTGTATTYLWHITSFSKNKEAAMRVLRVFYTNAEAANLIGNGIEGENYVMNAEGKVEFPEGKDMTNCGWTGMGASYYLPNSSTAPVWFYQPDDMWAMMAKTNTEAKASLALGFTFDSTPVADQVTACNNVIAQYYLPLINGEVNIDEVLPVFQKALVDAGIDKVIAEKQAQLDKWLAAK
jgi:ABC-type glycerol-3-phosphate transport system substrate-binding protein